MSRPLLTDPRFWPHFWTQFLGAFNDQLFKTALVVLIAFKSAPVWGIPGEQMVALCGGLFTLPFLLFSGTAGEVADRFSRSSLIVRVKAAEILIMLIGALGFLCDHVGLLLATLFLMGLQSTFFGPVKYSVLPQLLEQKELLAGNAYVEMGTFFSILLGTLLGSLLISVPRAGAGLIGGSVLLVAVLGLWVSLRIVPLTAAAPTLPIHRNPLRPTFETLRIAKKNRPVFLAILGISWFWFLGASFLSLLPPFCSRVLQGQESVVTLFLVLFCAGIGLGSLLCKRLSRGSLDLGLVPVGALFLSLFAFDLFLASSSPSEPQVGGGMRTVADFILTGRGARISGDFFLFAVSSGLFIVPLYTFMQERAREEERSRIVAGNNILNALFIGASALTLMSLFALGFSIPQVFLLLAVINLLITGYIYTTVPEFFYRLLCRIISKCLYRLKVVGGENIPASGPGVLISNHVSLVDWLLIASISPRPVRFIMHHQFLRIPLTGRIFRDARVIPIAEAKEDPKVLRSAFDRIAEELEAGELVCIFPEGYMTRDGKLGPFKSGIERIIKRTPVPVIPMALKGLWGSFFSRKYGKVMSRPFRRFLSRISIVVGKPVSPESVSALGLQGVVSELMLCR